MRLGLALPHYDASYASEDVSWESVRKIARLAESSGFHSVWVSDHLFLDWSKRGGGSARYGSLECWTTLAGVAAVTSRVRLGSLTLCNDLRNPALLAKMAASLDQLSGGRLDLGMGAGWYEPEYAAAGIGFDRPGVRIARLEEAAAIVGRLLEGEEVHHDGTHYQTRGAVCRPLPIQKPRPPIWVGGKGDRLLRVAAARADGWNMSWVGDVATYAERSRAADRACEEAGRDPATLRRSAGVYVLAGADEPDARRRFERLRERTPAGVMRSDKDARAVSWDEFRHGRIAGTVNEVIDGLGALSELGVEEAIVSFGALPFQVADEEDVEFLGTAVGPALATTIGGGE